MKRFFLLLTLIVISKPVFGIDPLREYKLRPEAYQLTYEEVKITVEDDVVLNAWVMPPASEKRRNAVFVLAGSDAGNMGFLLAYAFFLVKEGFTVVTFDYRGFGASSDFAYNPDFLYHTEYIQDFISVISWTKITLEPQSISVLAFSMGTLVTAAAYQEAPFDLFIGEGFIADPQKNIKRIKKLKGKRLQLPKTKINYRRKLKAMHIPVLLFAGTEDRNTPMADSADFVRKRANRQLAVFEGDHLKGAAVMGFPTYIDKIVKAVGQL